MPTVTVIQPTIAAEQNTTQRSVVPHIAEYQAIPKISSIPLWHKQGTMKRLLKARKPNSL